MCCENNSFHPPRAPWTESTGKAIERAPPRADASLRMPPGPRRPPAEDDKIQHAVWLHRLRSDTRMEDTVSATTMGSLSEDIVAPLPSPFSQNEAVSSGLLSSLISTRDEKTNALRPS